MAQKSKIARLPRDIRDELNRRLDNGETGPRLVAWLNASPRVREVLKNDFDGREINEQNICDWRNGGYLDWQARQETLALMREFRADSKEIAKESAGELTECLATVVAARYAAMLQGWNGEITDDMRRRLRGMKGLSREVVRLRHSERELERAKIEREALELKRQKTEEGVKKKFEEWAADAEFRKHITPKMTQEEMDRALYRLIHGKEKE